VGGIPLASFLHINARGKGSTGRKERLIFPVFKEKKRVREEKTINFSRAR
jgi:hypothetical protein